MKACAPTKRRFWNERWVTEQKGAKGVPKSRRSLAPSMFARSGLSFAHTRSVVHFLLLFPLPLCRHAPPFSARFDPFSSLRQEQARQEWSRSRTLQRAALPPLPRRPPPPPPRPSLSRLRSRRSPPPPPSLPRSRATSAPSPRSARSLPSASGATSSKSLAARWARTRSSFSRESTRR